MTYLYDIILNFQKNYYQFFEWLPKDNIINLKRIALYRVSDKDILYLKENKIIVTEELITKIKKDNKKQKKIMCIVSNGEIALALLFKDNGELIKRSSLIFEEEEEALLLVKKIKEIKILYKKNIKVKSNNIIRLEKEKKDKVIYYIKSNINIITLKYLYYECYEKELNDINLLKKSLLKELSKDWNENKKKIYKTINLFTKTNKIY